MRTVGVRELKEQTSEILRQVRDDGASFAVTYRGRVIARMVPVLPTSPSASSVAFWDTWDRLSEAVSARWPDDVSAGEVVREQRREL